MSKSKAINSRIADLLLLDHATLFEFPGMDEGTYSVQVTNAIKESVEGKWVLLRHGGIESPWTARSQAFKGSEAPHLIVEYSIQGQPNGLFWYPWRSEKELPDNLEPVQFEDFREAVLLALELVNGAVLLKEIPLVEEKEVRPTRIFADGPYHFCRWEQDDAEEQVTIEFLDKDDVFVIVYDDDKRNRGPYRVVDFGSEGGHHFVDYVSVNA